MDGWIERERERERYIYIYIYIYRVYTGPLRFSCLGVYLLVSGGVDSGRPGHWASTYPRVIRCGAEYLESMS